LIEHRRDSNVFAEALNDLFNDPNLGTDAVWRASGVGAGIPVRVIVRQPDRIAEFGATRVAAATTVLEIRTSEAPTLAEGDTLEFESADYVVQGEPMRDSAHLVWVAEVRPS
jgi:hypothetical protein